MIKHKGTFLAGLMIGALVGAILACAAFLLNEGIWYGAIRRDQAEMRITLERLEAERIEALIQIIEIFAEDLGKIASWPAGEKGGNQ